MSLLGQTARYLLLSALAIALLGSVGFYVLIHRTIQREVDEILVSQVEQVKQQLRQAPGTITILTGWNNNPHVERIFSSTAPFLRFSDCSLPDPLNPKQAVPFRQLSAIISANNLTYQITVQQAYYEFNELAGIMSAGVILGFLILIALTVLVGLGLSRRLWKPFYATIDQLDYFRLDEPKAPSFPDSPIREFNLLGQSLSELTQKLRRQFSLQKQFTENASHELQTPLAITLAELDFLLQSEHLTEIDHAHLQTATNALHRLSQLNRSLLLLTQVENDQFATDEVLNLSALVSQYVDEYEPLLVHKKMVVERRIIPAIAIRMNRQLVGVLLSNLLKNALRHGTAQSARHTGHVTISVTHDALTLQNTGHPLPFAANQLFNRFAKDPNRPDSTGLGLALVKQICDRYNLPLSYHFNVDTSQHTFRITLPGQLSSVFKISS